MEKYKPISICMNPKFDSKGLKLHVLEQLTIYSEPIQTSNYENYIDESKPYKQSSKLQSGLLYQLKQNNCKILICICMYNEQMQALDLTLHGVFNNLKYLNKIGITKNQIGVVLIQDGILKCQDEVINYYAQMDRRNNTKCILRERVDIIRKQINCAKQKGRLQKVIQNDNFPETIPKKVALLYQNKWQPEEQEGDQYLNLLSCFKHINGKKLSSHAWFFQGFCRYIKPEFCILLDVGTVPQEEGVVNLIKGMQDDPKVGGVSGFMGIDTNFASYESDVKRTAHQIAFTFRNVEFETLNNSLIQKKISSFLYETNTQTIKTRSEMNYSSIKENQKKLIPVDIQFSNKMNKINVDRSHPCIKYFKRMVCSVQKAQQVQYIVSHILDKNAESFTGFLHVLPGAWSGYRLKALHTQSTFEKDILQQKYFKTLIQPNLEQGQSGFKFANMYLAEDRILSLAIYCHKDNYYYLKYIPNAKANTDPMKTHYDLITQRRRWINSSNFAYQYVLANYQYDFEDSEHSNFDFLLIKLGMLLASCSYVNVYFIPCLYLFVLYSTLRNNGWIYPLIISEYLALFVSIIYLATLIICVGGSMLGSQWIKEIYQRDQNYKILKDNDKKPIKRDKAINGPAIYVSIIMAAITYTIVFTVASMISKILYTGILQFINTGTVDQMSFIVFLLMVINIGCYFMILGVHLFTHPKEIYYFIRGYLSYMTYQGVYTHTMVIYSFCNIHDVSWGTKGGNNKGEKKYQRQRLIFVSSWLFWNTCLCFLFFFIDFVLTATSQHYILFILAAYSTILLSLKTLLAIMNHFKFYLCCCLSKKVKK